jgi:hypothetical protein
MSHFGTPYAGVVVVVITIIIIIINSSNLKVGHHGLFRFRI